MSSLEQVVRPFAIEPFSARTLPPVQPVSDIKPNIVVEWGGPSTLIAKSIGVHDLNSGGKNWQEQSRQVHKKRVTNPSDPSQFVDVEAIDKMHFKDENGADHFLHMNNP